jgi:putative membrane protein
VYPMSSPSAPDTPDPGQPTGPNRREQARMAALVVLAVLITLFAVFNLDEVKVDWIFGSSKAPLIIVIVISLLVGIVLTYMAERRAKHSKDK